MNCNGWAEGRWPSSIQTHWVHEAFFAALAESMGTDAHDGRRRKVAYLARIACFA